MKISRNISAAVLTASLFAGCSAIQPSIQKSLFVVMKTPVFRYADQGFIQKSADSTKLEIYSSGVAVMKLEIGRSQVCNGTGLFSCMSKEEFNRRYLSPNYPSDTFEKILRGETLFGGKNVQKTDDGFVQRVVQPGIYDIEYRVSSSSITFRDTISAILIKIKEN